MSGFPSREVALRDGRRATLREVGPADEDALVRAFDSLDGHTRYLRFMASVKEAHRGRLRKALASFPANGQSIAATDATGEIVGTATFVLGHEPTSCEFAITVREAWAGAGLGRTLMEAIIAAARERGLREMVGFVLAQNTGMLALARRLGFEVTRDPDDPGVRRCVLALA